MQLVDSFLKMNSEVINLSQHFTGVFNKINDLSGFENSFHHSSQFLTHVKLNFTTLLKIAARN